jgi:flagellin
MSSILTNTSAMVALATLNDVNRGLTETQNRVSSGLQISSGKDNAAYFAISMTMKGDSGMFQAVNEGLTTTKNAISTGRLGAETVADLAQQFTERVAFAQGSGLDLADVQNELDGFIDRMNAAISQATFNGSNLIDSTDSVTVVTGISRASGSFATTTVTFSEVDLGAIVTALDAIDLTTSTDVAADLATAEGQYAAAVGAATDLGVAERTIEGQMDFLDSLIDTLDAGVGAMVDADMEEEAARLQAFQVQQQLAVQSLSIANQGPQNILSLFR